MTRALRVERALGSLLMLTIGLFTAAAVLTGTASPLYGQSGDSLQQKLASQFVLTKMAADRSDIVTPGTVVALLKFGLTLRSVAAPAPPLSTYKNGKISGPSFGADLKNTIFKVPGTELPPTIQSANSARWRGFGSPVCRSAVTGWF